MSIILYRILVRHIVYKYLHKSIEKRTKNQLY